VYRHLRDGDVLLVNRQVSSAFCQFNWCWALYVFCGFVNLLLWSGALVVLICLLLIDSQLCINQE
jgi:hypothetical protein